MPNVLWESVHNYLLSADRRMEHLERVRNLALSLFDQLKRSHGATRRDRSLLEVAAWLHDSGKVVNYYDHARHSAFIIAHAPLYGMRQLEQLKARSSQASTTASATRSCAPTATR